MKAELYFEQPHNATVFGKLDSNVPDFRTRSTVIILFLIYLFLLKNWFIYAKLDPRESWDK